MCQTISILNNKGGVGKTTSTGAIAQLLAYLNKRVLVVDLDQQSNLSMLFDAYEEDSAPVVSGVLKPKQQNIAEIFLYRYRTNEEVVQTVYPTQIEGIDILPSSKRHKNTQLHIQANQTGNNKIILKRALQTIKDNYDYILIDNAPSNDALTINSIFASDFILVPVRLESYSYKGLHETIDTIHYIKEEHDLTQPVIKGIFLTQCEKNTRLYKDLSKNYKESLEQNFCHTPIRKDIKACEINTLCQPLLSYCPNSKIVFDYSNLILELNILDTQSEETLKNSIGGSYES